MEVRIRHQDASESVHFCDCKFNEVDKVVKYIKQSGGIYIKEDSELLTDISHQIVLEESGAYVEMVVSDIEEQ